MEKEELHIEFNDQIVRYLSDEMTVSEKEQFEHLINVDSEKLAQFSAYKKIWDGVDHLAARSKYDMDGEWNMLADKIDFEPDERINTSGRSLRMIVLRVAAALVIGVLGVAGWYGGRQMLMYERVAVESGIKEIVLPDGTLLTLNSGSTIKYTKRESLSYRMIKLNGEAYFEVARDTTRPFIIDAGLARVEVLGTKFNVRAYPESKVVEVTVSSGLVAMASKRESDHQILLAKGNTGIYTREKKELNLIKSGNANAIAWKTRELVFTDTPIEEVIRVIAHTYNVDIVLVDPGLSEFTITVSFTNQELEAVLNVLESTLDLKIEKNGNQIRIDSE